jgi:hypothetical protein
VVMVSNNHITLKPYAHLGPDSSLPVTRLNFDENVQSEEIIDFDVYEKTSPRRNLSSQGSTQGR